MKGLVFAALCLAISGAVLMSASAPLDGPVPPPTFKEHRLPLYGLNGSGAGFCVSVPEADVTVTVERYQLHPQLRKKLGLSTDPASIEAEFRESVRNAAINGATVTGHLAVAAAARAEIAFPDLGDVVTDKTTMVCSCATSNCYGMPNSCVPTGCRPSCHDCMSCRVTRQIQ
jgi:hypothetical protein